MILMRARGRDKPFQVSCYVAASLEGGRYKAIGNVDLAIQEFGTRHHNPYSGKTKRKRMAKEARK